MLKQYLHQTWSVWVTVLLLCVLVGSLLKQLEISRANERELSRRIYQAVRQGYVMGLTANPPTTNSYAK